MNASPVKTTTDPESSSLPSCYSSSLPEVSEAASTESPSHPPSDSSPSRFPSPERSTSVAASSYFVTLTSGRHISKNTEETTSNNRFFGSHGDRIDNSFSINASNSYTPVTSVLGFRDMRRHCPPMGPSGHHSQVSTMQTAYLVFLVKCLKYP